VAAINGGVLMSISTVKLGGVVTEYVAAVNAFDEDGIVATFATRRAEADGHPRVPHPLYDARPRAGDCDCSHQPRLGR
jgi:hypothetical protein